MRLSVRQIERTKKFQDLKSGVVKSVAQAVRLIYEAGLQAKGL